MREKNVGYAPASRFAMGYFAPERITWLDGRAFLARIVVHLADSCNLKCRGCSHFANLFDEPGYDFDTMIRDFETIRKVAYAPCVYLLGGEPLLNPRIEEIMHETRRLFPDSDIEIITNGLLVPKMPESFFESVAGNGVRINITMYPPTWEQRDKIDAVLRKYRIHHMFSSKVEDFRAPFNPPGRLSDAGVAMKACGADYCRFLRNGRLYKCPVAALAYQYDACFGEDLLPREAGIDIGASDFHEQALRLCEPVKLCRYCAEQPRLQAWKVSTQPEAGDWY